MERSLATKMNRRYGKVDRWKTNQVAPRVPVRALDSERKRGGGREGGNREPAGTIVGGDTVLAHRYMLLRLRRPPAVSHTTTFWPQVIWRRFLVALADR
jgi:hypothetical protein